MNLELRQQAVYQLYHWLNHYNLFGSGYAEAVQSTLRHLGGR